MHALLNIIPIYLVLLIFTGSRDPVGYLLLTGIITMPFRTTYTLYVVPSHSMGWTSGLFISASNVSFILLLIYILINKKEFPHVKSKLDMAILCLIGAYSFSLINSTWTKMTFLQIIMFTKVAILYFYVPARAINNMKRLNQVLGFLSISVLFQSILTTMQFWTHNSYDYFSTGSGVNSFMTLGESSSLLRAYGTLGKPNSLAAYLVPIILLMIALSFLEKRTKIWNLAIVVGIFALIFTF